MKKEKILVFACILSLASFILIPLKTNALTGSNTNSGYNFTGSNVNSGYILTDTIPTPDNGPEGNLTNKLKKTIEFKTSEVNRKVVFNGTYTALKDNASIKFFGIEDVDKFMLDDDEDYFTKRCKKNKTSLEFYLTINGEEVDQTVKIDNACDFGFGAAQGVWIEEVKVKKGESVNVKVEVEIQGESQEDDMYKTQLILQSKSFVGSSSDIKEMLAPIKILKVGGNINPGYVFTGSNVNSGYVTTGSNVNIDDGKYSQLTNKLTKTIEFKANEINNKTLFDGTYTALKNHSIKGVSIEFVGGDSNDPFSEDCYNEIKFTLYIDGKEIESEYGKMGGNSCGGVSYRELSKSVNLNKGQSLKIKVEGESYNKNFRSKEGKYSYKINFYGKGGEKDVLASSNLAPIKIVDNDEFMIQTSSNENTVILKGNNSILSEFVIKPSKGNNKHLDELTIEFDDSFIDKDDITLMIDGTKYEATLNKSTFTYQPDIDISSKGVIVKVSLKSEPKYDDYTIRTNIKSINGKSIDKTFSKRFVSAIVYITKQENKGDYTEFTVGIEKYDDNFSISSICMLTGSTRAGTCLLGEKYADGPFEDGYTFSVNNTNSVQSINYITYFLKDSERNGWGDSISINREQYPDYFKTKSGEQRKVYAKYTTSTEESSTNKSRKYSDEMVEAYKFAYENGITTAKTIEKAKMKSPLTRIEMAKMLSNYAINVLGKEPDTSKGTIEFKDVSNKMNKQYNYAITLAYQLGIMGQNIKNNKFRPNDTVTRAEFAAALSRLLFGTPDGKPYYSTHIEKLYEAGIINKKDPKIKEIRGYVMIMLMRAAQ